MKYSSRDRIHKILMKLGSIQQTLLISFIVFVTLSQAIGCSTAQMMFLYPDAKKEVKR